MSLWSAYRGLTSNTRLVFGLGLLAWGGIGLAWGDSVGDTLGIKPTEQDQANLDKMKPKIIVVDRNEKP